MFESMLSWNTLVVLGGTAALGLGSGVLGSFAVLRRESLVGDALAHAALPGLCLAYMLTGEKNLPVLLIGAAVTGTLGVWIIGTAVRQTRLKQDAVIGAVLSVFFGAGMALLGVIQKKYAGGAAGLNSYIYGKAASMVFEDLFWITGLALAILVVTLLFYKELVLVSFDPGYAASLGYPVWLLNQLFLVLLAAEVVVGLQAVGVILIAGLLIIPGATARLWTERMSRLVWIAGLLGMVSGVAGTLLSASVDNVGTGPVIILVAAAAFLISLICAPRRGLISRAWELHRTRQQMRHQHLMRAAYEFLEQRGQGFEAPLPVQAFADFRQVGVVEIMRDCEAMVRLGWARAHSDAYELTAEGREAMVHAARVHRLWEEYFRQKTDVPLNELHQQADRLEHVPIEPPLVNSSPHLPSLAGLPGLTSRADLANLADGAGRPVPPADPNATGANNASGSPPR